MLPLIVSNFTAGICMLGSLIIGFVGGCIWYSSLKSSESKIEPPVKKKSEVIDIERALFKDNTYEWRKNN